LLLPTDLPQGVFVVVTRRHGELRVAPDTPDWLTSVQLSSPRSGWTTSKVSRSRSSPAWPAPATSRPTLS
jgi:hypothetical protein